MAEQDLKINISVDDHGASDKLKGIHSLLKDINQSVGSLNNNGGLPATNRLLKEFAGALKELSSVNGANIYSLGKQVNHMLVTLGRLDVSKYSTNIDKTTAQLGKMLQTFAGFSSTSDKANVGTEALSKLPDVLKNFDEVPDKQIELITRTFTALAQATQDASKNGSGINSLKNGIKGLPDAFDSFGKAKDYAEPIKEIKDTIADLGNVKVPGGSSFQSAVDAVDKLPDAFRKFGTAEGYSGKIEEITKTLNMLAPAISNIAGYGTGIKNLASGLETLPKALDKFQSADQYKNNIDALSATLTRLKDVAKSVDKDSIKGFRGLISSVSTLSRVSGKENLDTQLDALASSIKRFVSNLSSVSDAQAQKVYNLGVGLKSLVDASRGLEEAERRLASIGKGFWLSTIMKSIKALGSEFKKLPRRVFDVVKAFGKLTAIPFKPFINGIKQLHERVARFLHSVGRIALYRAIRSGIKMITQGAKEGIDNLYKWAQIVGNDFAPTMDHLASEFLYLKNSVGAAISPIIQSLEPVITDLIHKFVELLNVFNQFFSMLSGRQTYRRAIYYATTYGEQIEDSMSGAGKSAKELKDILMDFDQLNLITTPKDRTRGSGDDEEDYALMFEEVAIEQGLFDWIDNMKWQQIGERFSNKITEMLNSINWNAIKEKASSIGSKLGSLLNGIFTNEDMFTALGRTLAEALNTSSAFVNSLFDNIDFRKIGGNIASALKSFIGTAKMGEIGRALTAGLSALADILIGFTDNMSAKDWNALSMSIYKLFASAMANIPWERLVPSLVELATGLVKSINAALEGIASQKGRIMKGLKDADWESFRSALGALFSTLCTDIPVVPALVITSIAKVTIATAAMTAFKQLFTASLAKALGASAGGAGASAGASGLGALGAGGGAIAALPYVAIAVAAVVTAIISQVKWRDAEGKQWTKDSLATEFKKSNNPDFTFLTNMGGALISAEDVERVTEKIGEYKEKLKELYDLGMANPRQLGFNSTGEVETWYETMSGALYEGGEEAVRASVKIDELWKRFGSFIGDTKKGADEGAEKIRTIGTEAEKAGSKVVQSNTSLKDKALSALDEMNNKGKISLIKYTELYTAICNGNTKVVSDAIAETKRLFNSTIGDFQKWGSDISSGISLGINSKAGLVHQAVVGLANDIKRNMAFSEPEEGPLSDFHTYMPDMLDLMAQGIRENAYKVENEVLALAGTVSGIRDIPINPTKEASGTQDMASGIYEANAEERALLRELITAVKEQRLTISPSATLGKVVNQSTRLYAGVTG